MPARARVSSTSSLLSRRDGMVVRLPPFGGASAVPSITEWQSKGSAVDRLPARRSHWGTAFPTSKPRQPGKVHEGCSVDLVGAGLSAAGAPLPQVPGTTAKPPQAEQLQRTADAVPVERPDLVGTRLLQELLDLVLLHGHVPQTSF